MQKMQEQQDEYKNFRSSSMVDPSQKEVIAGKNTFGIDAGKKPSYYQHGRYFTPKMLNHAD